MESSKKMVEETTRRPPKVSSCSRLQKKAPASLQIDKKMSISGSSNCPIPLLSPLVVSATSEDENVMSGDDNGASKHVQGSSSSLQNGGWQHPAIGTFTEPSTVLALFQSQCALANSRR